MMQALLKPILAHQEKKRSQKESRDSIQEAYGQPGEQEEDQNQWRFANRTS